METQSRYECGLCGRRDCTCKLDLRPISWRESNKDGRALTQKELLALGLGLDHSGSND